MPLKFEKPYRAMSVNNSLQNCGRWQPQRKVGGTGQLEKWLPQWGI